MTKGIRKVKKGVDIFNKRILVLVSFTRTQCFRIREREANIVFFTKWGVLHCYSTNGFCSATRNWRELYKNLTALRFLDTYTVHIEPDSMEFLMSLDAY